MYVHSDSKDLASLLGLPIPTFVPHRYRPELSAWSGHLPFANDLIATIRPSLIVELGTHWGESYFAFCQSVRENGLGCLCYAVDNWSGDPHAGFYGEDVFNDVRSYNDSRYKDHSYLLRTDFDNALSHFNDQSIDLLHIDGFHTYEAVAHDFRQWLPKVKLGGIILMHDIAVRREDFGVWRLWEELQTEFGNTFTFHHAWGLGVLQTSTINTHRAPFLDLLFASCPATKEQIRRHYVMYASHLDHMLRSGAEAASADRPSAEEANVQVFTCGSNGYSETRSVTRRIRLDTLEHVSFDLPHGLSAGPIRMDPADCPCVVEVFGVTVIDESNSVIWSADNAPSLRNLTFAGSASLLPEDDVCRVLSYGSDPQIILPNLRSESNSVSLRLSIRVSKALITAVHTLREQVDKLERERDEQQRQLSALSCRIEKEQRRRSEAQSKVDRLSQLLTETENEVKEQRLIIEEIYKKAEEREQYITHLAARESEAQSALYAVQVSRSWKATAPMRSAAAQVRALFTVARRCGHALHLIATLRGSEVYRRWMRQRRAETIINSSDLFDSEWYKMNSPDVAKTGINLCRHYISHGSAEGRRPNPLFDPAWYRAEYPDVVASGMEPLAHYIRYGSAEGRRPNPLFDPAWYRAEYPDVVASGMEPLAHYIRYGSAEGRRPNPLFDPAWYRAEYPDVVASGMEPLAHYIHHGFPESRRPTPLFDPDFYRNTYPDVCASKLDPFVHYVLYGSKEERDPSATSRSSRRASCLGLLTPLRSLNVGIGLVTYNNSPKELQRCLRSILIALD
ncbi:MAG: class I SAM-dependent methyltransferase, partial [Acidobacteriaceae bacterium]|nr:class I SAM-dependent methyltransferase [Acidobacteriaceae bacterium]